MLLPNLLWLELGDQTHTQHGIKVLRHWKSAHAGQQRSGSRHNCKGHHMEELHFALHGLLLTHCIVFDHLRSFAVLVCGRRHLGSSSITPVCASQNSS